MTSDAQPVSGTSAAGPSTPMPEVLEADARALGMVDQPPGSGEAITQPAKLIRIASMVRMMLEEARRAEVDDAGRRALREIHERSVEALSSVLSDDLQAELADIVLPLSAETPSESELRIAQAQLVGWLEGLFHGIQATMATQQMMAQAQLEQVRRQALNSPSPRPGSGAYI